MWDKGRLLLIAALLMIAGCVICAETSYDADAETVTGLCGGNLTYTLNTETGVLSITGTGAMQDYTELNGLSTAPWGSYHESITALSISEGVTTIGDSAFNRCYGLTSVTIPSGVISIGDHAFQYCIHLAEVINHSSLNIVKGSEDHGGVAYYALNVHSGTTKQFQYAYGGNTFTFMRTTDDNDVASYHLICASVNEGALNLPSSFTYGEYTVSTYSINTLAFGGCFDFTSVTIPSTVTSIGSNAFYGCFHLAEVINHSSLNIVKESTSYGLVAYYALDVHSGTTKQFQYAYGGNTFTFMRMIDANDVSSYHLISASVNEGELNLPSPFTYGDHMVSTYSISQFAFYRCSDLTGTLTIPSGVTSIGYYAFYNCSGLTGALTIPSSVTSIDSYAFLDCSSLTGTLTIPSGVTTIGSHAFCNCSSLTGALTIPSTVTSIGHSAFFKCTGFTGTLITPSSVTTISDRAFSGCSGLTSVIISEGVTTIGDDAFAHCYGLTSVTIPSGVTTIGDDAFQCCYRLAEVINHSSLNIVKGSSSYGYAAYYALDVHNGTTKQFQYAYGGNTFTFMRTTDDNDVASYHLICASVNEGALNLPSPFTYGEYTVSTYNINQHAFYDCSRISSITIPSGVTSIGYCAFWKCYRLAEVINHSSLNIVKGSSSYGYAAYFALDVHSGTTKQFQYAYEGNTFTFMRTTDDNDVASYHLICASVNEGALNLPSSFTYGEHVVSTYSINTGAFYECSSLTGTLTIPSSVTFIGDWAFFDCSGLTGALTIPSSVTFIGSYAFGYCSGLTNVTIPSSVTSIGSYAFNNCSGITSISIASGVSGIDSDAFSGWKFYDTDGSTQITDVSDLPGYIYSGTTTHMVRQSSSAFTVMIQSDNTEYGTVSPASIANVPYGSVISIIGNTMTVNGTTVTATPSASAAGYTYSFSSWSVSNGTVVTGDMSVTAHFERSSSSHSVTYDVAGGSAPAPTQEPVVEGSSFTVASYSGTKTGSAFMGWNDGTDTYKPGESYTMGSTDVTLTAVWRECDGMCGDSLYYRVDPSTKVLTIFGIGAMYDYPIPANLPWYSQRSEMTALVLEDGVTSIGCNAFFVCTGFTGTLTIPSTVTSIGESAFYECTGFTGTLTIPSAVTSIGYVAFCGSGFSSIEVSESNLKYSSVDGILSDKNKTKLIQATLGNSKSNYTIPSTVSSIGDSAFYGCIGFTGTLTIHSNVTFIDVCAFCESGFSSIEVSESNPQYSSFDGILFDKSKTKLIQATVGNSKSDYTTPSTVSTIGCSAFAGCTGLTGTLTIPSTVGSIEGAAFWKCTGLTSLIISEGVTAISDDAFCDCTGLTGAITIPSTVTSFGNSVFYGCTGITSMTIQSGVTGISPYAFIGWSFYETDGTTLISDMSDLPGYTYEGTITKMVRQPNVVSHSVTYDIAGGSASAPIQEPVAEGSSFTVASYSGTKYGYEFGGWNDGTSVYQPGDQYAMGASDVALTAVWNELEHLCIECSDTEWYGTGDARMELSISYNPGVSSIRVSVAYDSSVMSLKDAESSGLLELTQVNASKNPFTVYLEVEDLGTDVTGTGSLVTLVFEVDADAELGTYPVTLTVIESYKDNGTPVPVDTEDGSLVIRTMPGDINGDGKVDSRDSLLLRKYIARWSVTILGNPDVDGDGSVGLPDSLLLKRFLADWDVVLH